MQLGPKKTICILYGMHSIGTVNEENNQSNYQPQYDGIKWDKYQHLKVIYIILEITWDASLSFFMQNGQNLWCMKVIFWSFIVHQKLPRQ